MTDIIERLRDHFITTPICQEAADEIERLRAALQEIAALPCRERGFGDAPLCNQSSPHPCEACRARFALEGGE